MRYTQPKETPKEKKYCEGCGAHSELFTYGRKHYCKTCVITRTGIGDILIALKNIDLDWTDGLTPAEVHDFIDVTESAANSYMGLLARMGSIFRLKVHDHGKAYFVYFIDEKDMLAKLPQEKLVTSAIPKGTIIERPKHKGTFFLAVDHHEEEHKTTVLILSAVTRGVRSYHLNSTKEAQDKIGELMKSYDFKEIFIDQKDLMDLKMKIKRNPVLEAR